MKNLIKYLLTTSMLVAALLGNAQIKNERIEIFKVYGNCGMCESKIEKAGNIKNQSRVDWNQESKMATISYDSLKTSTENILKRIALAGYDSDIFLAPNDIYASLPSCCKYERSNGVVGKMHDQTMEKISTDHSMHSSITTEIQSATPLSSVFDSYFAIKDALVNTDGSAAATNAKNMLTAIGDVNMSKLSTKVHTIWMNVLQYLKEDVKQIADTKDTSHQRAHFETLSKNIYELMKVSPYELPAYYQFCPMANDGKGANWLSKQQAIKNPYYGSQMLSCGKTVETIKN